MSAELIFGIYAGVAAAVAFGGHFWAGYVDDLDPAAAGLLAVMWPVVLFVCAVSLPFWGAYKLGAAVRHLSRRGAQ